MDEMNQAPVPEAKGMTGAVWAVVALLIVGGIVYAATGSSAPTEGEKMMEGAGNVPGEAMEDSEKGDAMVEGGDKAADDGSMGEASAGSYERYDVSKLALANDGDVVLFFHASWCPSCRSADAAISAAPVPAGLTILKIDYDASAALKQRYGVTTQHTFVQVDAAGNLIAKWSGSPDAADIAARVK